MKYGVLLLPVLLLQACSSVEVRQGQRYDLSSKQYLYQLSNWSFEGRVAVRTAADSWSSSIAWRHQAGMDELKLSGPLGQGAVVIRLTAAGVVIDHGDGRVEHALDADRLIAEKLGVFVPVSALRYWVLGVVQPGVGFQDRETGFNQSGWDVDYPLFMLVDSELFPHKMKVSKDEIRLKLVFDQWRVNES